MDTRGEGRSHIARRLAGEGVPLGAIARALDMSVPNVRKALRPLIAQGVLRDMPAGDWPDGTRVRAPTVPARSLDDLLPRAAEAQHWLGLTRAESIFLAALLTYGGIDTPTLTRLVGADGANRSLIKVYACHLRKKLKRHKIAFATVWGTGYAMDPAMRARLSALLTVNTEDRHAA